MQLYDAPPNSLKVSAVTDVRELCAAIIRACHANNLPALLTIGNQSVNQAVKGIAAASAELAQLAAAAAAPYDPLTFQPAFRHANRTKPLIAFYLSRYRHVTQRLDTGEESELTATANQKIVPLAGAVANKVRAGARGAGVPRSHAGRGARGRASSSASPAPRRCASTSACGCCPLAPTP